MRRLSPERLARLAAVKKEAGARGRDFLEREPKTEAVETSSRQQYVQQPEPGNEPGPNLRPC
ncbi:hypothetical protein T261_8543 [Streptomyces lydicus]|nr:hypothetical protein T261_8543 [Streptomyces lydicus]